MAGIKKKMKKHPLNSKLVTTNLVILSVLQMLDLLSTDLGIKAGGKEGNPFANFMLNWGLEGLIVAKIGMLIVVCSSVLYYHFNSNNYNRDAKQLNYIFGLFVVIYSAVVVNNFAGYVTA